MPKPTALSRRLHIALAAGEEFDGSVFDTAKRPQPAWLGRAFEKRRAAGSTLYVISPELGVTLGISIGFETVVGVVLAPGGQLLARHEHPDPLPFQLASPRRVAPRVTSVIHDLLRKVPRAWRDLTGRPLGPRGLPVLGVSVATPFWATPDGRPRGTRFDEAWTSTHNGRVGHHAAELVARALRQNDKTGRQGERVPQYISVANMFACEALASAYLASPERAPTSPLAVNDMNWRTMLLLHAGCGLGAASIRLPPQPLDAMEGVEQFSFLHARLHGGALGAAGAIAHLPMPAHTALFPCSCGNPDEVHLEQIASGYALGQQLIEQIPEEFRDRKRHIAWLLELRDTNSGEFHRAASRSGRLIGAAIGPAVTILDPIAIVTSGFLADESFNAALTTAVTRSGPRPVGRVKALPTAPNETMFLASRGAALLEMRNRLWRRWPGFQALNSPTAFGDSPGDSLLGNADAKALWLQIPAR